MERDLFKSKLHHVGIVVPDLARVDLLVALLGLTRGAEEYVAEYEADCYFTTGPGACIEFIVPRGGKLSRFNKGVGGIHHIALEVEDLVAATAQLSENGVKMLEQTFVDAGDLAINFVPPLYTRGIVVELVQRKTDVTAARSSDKDQS
jgi:methylmalonyl-CoA/ethylmalonyl-CoA epimerase